MLVIENPKLLKVEVLCREENFIPRKVKEAIFTQKEPKPILTRDEGYEFAYIYDPLLATTSSIRMPPMLRSR